MGDLEELRVVLRLTTRRIPSSDVLHGPLQGRKEKLSSVRGIGNRREAQFGFIFFCISSHLATHFFGSSSKAALQPVQQTQ